jgi:hypothetical protein
MTSSFKHLIGMRGVALAAVGALALGGNAFGEDAERPKPDGGKPDGEGRRGREGRGDRPRGGDEGRGREDGRGRGFNRNIPPDQAIQMASRMAGLDLGPKYAPKINALPFGAARNLIVSVPVGAIDSFGSGAPPIKIEDLFKLTPEQTESIGAIRQEYQKEQEVLEKELAEQQKLIAEKARQLRLKYELRANDVLAGEQKTQKETIDAAASEMYGKTTAAIDEALAALKDAEGPAVLESAKAVQEKAAAIVEEAQKKALAAMPAEARALFENALKQRAERMARWRQGGPGGPGEGGRGRRPDGEVPQPPRPPEGDGPQF